MSNLKIDTIAAISTTIGHGAIGIVRLSGPACIHIAEKIFRFQSSASIKTLPSHKLRLGHIIDGQKTVDEVLLVVMKAPHSYTRQDMVEIHCHGGHASVRSILDLVLRHGARLARPGEFTRLAFEAGRIDLTQAQAVMEIIEAKTDAALRSAVARLSGRLDKHLSTVKELLLQALSELEAAVDFPDEDLGDLQQLLSANIKKAQKITYDLLAGEKAARLYKDGLSVVIVGKPNAGKSSLFNRLLHTSRAIVTSEPGTTRDLIEETLSIDGVPVRLVDSAGLREARGEAERFGIEMARKAMEQANLVLAVLDSSRVVEREDLDMIESIGTNKAPALYILNKVDLPQKLDTSSFPVKPAIEVKTCATTGAGSRELIQAISQKLLEKNISAPEDALIASARESDCIKRTNKCLKRARRALEAGIDLEAMSIDLRDALSELGQLLGQTSDEDILEQIFNRFCIGK